MADRTCKTSDGVYTTMRENYSNRTQEQDIVERLLYLAASERDIQTNAALREAAQTIAALRAERDEQKQDACKWFSEALEQKQRAEAALRARYDKMREDAFTWKGMYLSADKRAEAAEAHIKELEAEISNLDAELDHWSQLAVDDLGKNPPTSWKEIAATAIRERDELRKALEPFAMAADELDDKDEDRYEIWEHPVAMNITIGDLRRARASSNREGGEE